MLPKKQLEKMSYKSYDIHEHAMRSNVHDCNPYFITPTTNKNPWKLFEFNTIQYKIAKKSYKLNQIAEIFFRNLIANIKYTETLAQKKEKRRKH